jgi:hypothetical protein
MIKKQIKKKEEYFIDFTDEELKELKMQKGMKFSWNLNEDNTISLIPYEKIDLDLNDFSKEILIFLIKYSVDEDLTIEEAFEKILTEAMDHEISRNNIK